MSFQENENLEI